MRHTILTPGEPESPAPTIPGLFVPMLASIAAEAEADTGQGPAAAIGLYVETLGVVAKLIDLAIDRDAETLTLLTNAEIEIGDLVVTAEHVSERITALFASLN